MSAATTTPAAGTAAPASRLVNASTGRRFVARLIDALLLAVVTAVTAVVAAAQGPAGAVVPVVVTGSVIALLVVVVQWWWEATCGRTVGGVTVGIRTVDSHEAAPGWWRVLVRTAVVAVAGVVPVVGPVLVTVSNVWDRDRRRQGWHDKAAGTWVVDASLGRDPLADARPRLRPATPGSGEPSVASPAASPASAAAAIAPVPPAATPTAGAPVSAAPVTSVTSAEVASAVTAPSGSAAATATATATPAASADDDLEQTRMSRPRSTAWRLAFDDGSALTLRGQALVGRNPVGPAEEADVLLVNLPDPGRSISKTHAHLSSHADGVWVTDRCSTNGTAITPPHGDRAEVQPGVPVLAVDGALIHLGDRTVVVSRT